MNARFLDNLRHIKAAAEESAAPAGRKKMTPSERARHASLVRWGKEQPFAARLEQVKERRRKAKLAKARGGKGKAKKPVATPEQQAAEKEQQRQANVAALGQALDNADNEAMSSRGLAALEGARKGEEPEKGMADGLIKGGFAERGADGRFRLTPEGRSLMRAADKGDEQAALDAISRASDRAARNTEREQRKAEQEKKKAEKGGGGGKKPKKEKAAPKEAEEEEADEPPTDEEVAAETATEVGLDEETVDALRDAADGAGSENEELAALGLIDSDGDATPEGVNALDALERGDARGYRRAVRAAKARKRREGRQQEQEKARTEERDRRTAERMQQQKERTAELDAREGERQSRSKANQDKRVAAEVERIAAARARKSMDELQPILDDIAALKAELKEVCEPATKAGRRNSGADQALVDQGYALSMQLCELFESLGATVEEEEEVEGGEVEMMEGKSAEEIHDALDIVAVVAGTEIKTLDGGGIGAYAVRFGSADEPDLSPMKDYFTKSTDFWIDAWDRRPMLFHHAMDEDTADAPRIGTWTKAEIKDEGVWLEGQLDKGHRYYGAIKELVRRGVLRLSSDSAPHLVRRATKAGGVHEVTRWPLLAASLTPTPAEPRLTAVSFKALVAELGLNDIQDNPEAIEEDEGERSDETKAQSDRARRLLLLTELELAMEATV